MAGTIRALLVGIDSYLAVTGLEGCGNDIEAAEQVLRVRAESAGTTLAVRTLRDAQATRAALIATFVEHLGSTGPDDVAVFWFSGHGSQEAAPEALWHTEPDQLVETLVCHDSRTDGVFDLADKELAQLLRLAASRGGHVLAVLDCCHSGGGTRDLEPATTARGIRSAPRDDRVRPPEAVLGRGAGGGAGQSGAGTTVTATAGAATAGTAAAGTATADRTVDPAPAAAAAPVPRWVALSACRADQTAKERPVRGVPRGVLSAALERALTGAIGPLSYRDIHRMCSATTLDLVPDQTPQLEVTDPADLDRPFLGGAAVLAGHPFTVSIRGGRWLLDGGAVHGLPDPAVARTEITLFPIGAAPDLSEPSRPLARGVLSAVEVGESAVEMTDGAGSLDPSRTYRASVGRSGLAPGTADSGREAHIRRWHDLLDRRNPGTTIPVGAVEVVVEHPDGTPVPLDGALQVRCPPGQRWAPVRVRVINRLGPRLFCALFALTQDYGVVPLLPGGGAWLATGEQAWVLDAAGEPQIRMTVAAERSCAVDVLKLFVSTVEFDAQQMHQEELSADTSRGLSLSAGAAAADAAAVAAPDWRTAEWVVATTTGP